MGNRSAEADLAEASLQGLRHHYRAMPAAGAANPDSQIAFALALKPRQQISQHICKPPNRVFHFGFGRQVFYYPGIASGEGPKLGHEVRIGQKSHIKEHIDLSRQSVSEPERQYVDAHIVSAAVFGKPVLDNVPERVDGVLR